LLSDKKGAVPRRACGTRSSRGATDGSDALAPDIGEIILPRERRGRQPESERPPAIWHSSPPRRPPLQPQSLLMHHPNSGSKRATRHVLSGGKRFHPTPEI